jgi:hypothetical protein
MDVLEHVDDDVGILRDAMSSAAPDATFLISVPAFQFMCSGHDASLEHKRRYTLRGVERDASAAQHAAHEIEQTTEISAAQRLMDDFQLLGQYGDSAV